MDLDLFAHALGQPMPVYYNNPVSQSPKARHLKDIRSGASGTAFLETIIYDEDINACELVVGVNLYSGTLPDDRVWLALFVSRWVIRFLKKPSP